MDLTNQNNSKNKKKLKKRLIDCWLFNFKKDKRRKLHIRVPGNIESLFSGCIYNVYIQCISYGWYDN